MRPRRTDRSGGGGGEEAYLGHDVAIDAVAELEHDNVRDGALAGHQGCGPAGDAKGVEQDDAHDSKDEKQEDGEADGGGPAGGLVVVVEGVERVFLVEREGDHGGRELS